MHQSVLLLLHALKPLEINDQDLWGAEDLKLLDCLFVKLASTAKPCVLVREFLWSHELSETIINSDFVILENV